MKLGFLMPHHIKNSMRNKAICKNLFRETHTPQTECGPLRRRQQHQGKIILKYKYIKIIPKAILLLLIIIDKLLLFFL